MSNNLLYMDTGGWTEGANGASDCCLQSSSPPLYQCQQRGSDHCLEQQLTDPQKSRSE